MSAAVAPSLSSFRALPRPAHDKRERITRAAIALFLVNGFDETTVDEIVLAAGIARRTFFRYFATKEALVSQFFDHFGTHIVEEIEARPPAEPPLEAMLQGALRIHPTGMLDPGWAVPLNRLIARTPALRAAGLDRACEWERDIAAVLARRMGACPGDLAPRLIAGLGMTAVNLGTETWVMSQGTVSQADATRQAFAALGDLMDATASPGSAIQLAAGWGAAADRGLRPS